MVAKTYEIAEKEKLENTLFRKDVLFQQVIKTSTYILHSETENTCFDLL